MFLVILNLLKHNCSTLPFDGVDSHRPGLALRLSQQNLPVGSIQPHHLQEHFHIKGVGEVDVTWMGGQGKLS